MKGVSGTAPCYPLAIEGSPGLSVHPRCEYNVAGGRQWKTSLINFVISGYCPTVVPSILPCTQDMADL